MATEDSSNTRRASQMTPEEMRGLAARLRARAESVLLRRQPEQHRDLMTAASLVDQFPNLSAEIDRLAGLLKIAGGA